VNTGVPSAGFHDVSMLKIFRADNSNIRSMAGTSFCGVSLESIFRAIVGRSRNRLEESMIYDA
jgi:hypothetical protein